MKPISDCEFSAVFPDPVSLRYGTHSAELTLALNKLSVNISVPLVDALATAVLDTAWVQIRGLPPIAKSERVICSISKILGKVIVVYELSLFKGEAMRANVKSIDPSKLQATVWVFFNGIGYDLRISVEGADRGNGRRPDDGGDTMHRRGREGHHCRRDQSPGFEAEDALSDLDDHSPNAMGTRRPRVEVLLPRPLWRPPRRCWRWP